MSYFTSISRQNEFETNSDSVIPLFSVTYFLAISISILSCLRYCVVLKKMSNKHVYVSLGMSLSYSLFPQVGLCQDEGVGGCVRRRLRRFGRVGQLWTAAVLRDAVCHDCGHSTLSDSRSITFINFITYWRLTADADKLTVSVSSRCWC